MKKILLTFDVEEFDLPLEYGQSISIEQQLAIGKAGLDETMAIIAEFDIPTTLYTTAFFASNFPENIKSLSDKHEIASHAYYHSQFEAKDLLLSRQKLAEITQKEIKGFRMPRLAPFSYQDLAQAGYFYDSSLNPTYLPGRYNNLHAPKQPFLKENIHILPTSVTPNFRIPLFWLSFKNFPILLYLFWAKYTLEKEGFLNLYFHPWEFTDISMFQFPFFLKKDKNVMQDKLRQLIRYFQAQKDVEFVTSSVFLQENA